MRLIAVLALILGALPGHGSVGTGTVAGVFLDHGRPVAGGYVALYRGEHRARSGPTDARGRFRLTQVPAGSYEMQFTTRYDVERPVQRIWHQPVVTVRAGAVSTVDEHTRPTGGLTVRAPGRFCVSVTRPGTNWGGCAPDGVLRLEGLSPGAYAVQVVGDSLHGSVDDLSAMVGAGTVAELTTALPAAGAVTTTVRDARTGRPVSGVCLHAQPAAAAGALFGLGGEPSGPCSDGTGAVRIGHLEPGAYHLYAQPTATAYGAQWLSDNGGTGQRQAASVVRISAGGVTTAPGVRLDPAGKITGRVTDSAGRPVAKVCAFPYAVAASFMQAKTCSDAEGDYTLDGLGPYSWPVEFVNLGLDHAWQWSGGAPDSASAALARVGTTVDALVPAGVAITGRVAVPAGSSATVYAYSAATGEYATRYARVGADGRFRLGGLAPQEVKLAVVRAGDAAPRWYGGSSFASASRVTAPATDVNF